MAAPKSSSQSASKSDTALRLLAEHFAGDEANYRNRDLGAKLQAVLAGEPVPDDDADDDADPDAE